MHEPTNSAVGFYNAPGGEAIRKMWANHGAPNADLAQMPEGTVGAKVLFTTPPVSEVPFLAGSPEWDAYVYADPNDTNPGPTSPRAVMKVRLLQIDIAVKDSRAKETGWIFGTFVYGGGPGGQPGSGWFNVAPVGVMWGNDPGYSGTGPLTQTWLNPEVHMPHVGYQGRLNGPVDNPISSCMSCHATAELPQGTMVPPRGSDPAPWFQNIKSGTPFGKVFRPPPVDRGRTYQIDTSGAPGSPTPRRCPWAYSDCCWTARPAVSSSHRRSRWRSLFRSRYELLHLCVRGRLVWSQE